MSLVVTPEQANRITLAENLGEITLIPRHPDDEAVVDDFEQNADDLFNPSTANSRKREQFGTKGKEDAGPLDGLRSLMTQAMTAATAQTAVAAQAPVQPFEMTIIYPSEVKKVPFDAAGQPLLGELGSAAPQSAVAVPAPGAAPAAADVPEDPPADAPSSTPADFPIDLQVK